MHIVKPRFQDFSREKITTFLFEAGLKCMTKCFLRSQGETGSGNAFADWAMGQMESYRKEGIRYLIEEAMQNGWIIDSTGMGSQNLLKWQLALNLVATTQNLKSSLHAVERAYSQRGGKPTQLVPIRLIFSNMIIKDDKFLLAFDALVLSEMLGCEISIGMIIHGDSHTKRKVRTSFMAKEVQKVIQKIQAMLSSNSPPDLVLNRHCVECEFQARCRMKAIEKNELSLLSGMTEKDRKKFNDKGIFTITQLSYSFRPRRRPKRRPERREKYHHSLKALSIREKKIYIVGRPELKIEGNPVFMDVEGLPDRDSYYLIGIRLKTAEGMIQHSLWADKSDAEEKIWADFRDILSAIENPILIHYGSYETTFIRRMCSRYGAPPQGSKMDKAIGSMVNLVSVIFAQIYFPTFSNGLKEVAEHLGFSWSVPTVTGVQTIAWRYKWETSRDPTLKQGLLSYNAQDCEALQLITAKIVDLCQTILESGSSSLKDAVHTERLKRENSFGFKRNSFSSPELDAINKAAYWDYQRERVYVKSNKRLRSFSSCSSRVRKVLSVNKTIECPRPRSCPRCASVRFFKHVKMSKTVADLKFMRHGIKRWVIRYLFNRYKCQTCGATFILEERPWMRCKLGHGILAYLLYQNIGLLLPQKNVDRSINRLFGFNLAMGTTGRIKEKAGRIYKETYDKIVYRLCNGHLLHVDETKVSVGGMDGYVWVLANMEEVAYIYSETRQGETIQGFLKEFRGVLVSDFYAAYDGIRCPQQKCLIHLIRDLNDAVLKYPFDEELKNFVKGFADLVRPMVETVDRHGLKRHFLRKHLVAVDRFYSRISRTAFQSESAVKFKERFEKNRDKLFTFLLYDGVPWNNNNAEHAIKAFAMLRHIINGVTSEKGLRNYLIMLSICETCKYKRIDFLDFLLSGEKDIGTSVKSRRRKWISPLGGIIPTED